MRRIIPAILLCFLLAAPAAATHVESIEDSIVAALEAEKAGDPSGRADLYEIATSTEIPPACARLADITLTGILLIEAGTEYPESEAIKVLFGFIAKAVPTLRNDCLLAT